MPQVTVTINEHPYSVACDAGQEQRIRELARMIESRMAGFAAHSQKAGEARLLVMAALLLADELSEAQEKLRRGFDGNGRDESALAAGILRLAARVEAVAETLEDTHI